MANEQYAGFHPSPLGPIQYRFDADGALTRLDFAEDGAVTRDGPLISSTTSGWPTAAASAAKTLGQQLDEYFAGTRRQFALPLRLSGTEFQRAVWETLLFITYGRTISYGELARRVDERLDGAASTAVTSLRTRAVGRANALNPVAIIVPCHRVIGQGGSLTGYAGGIERKAALLRLEGALI